MLAVLQAPDNVIVDSSLVGDTASSRTAPHHLDSFLEFFLHFLERKARGEVRPTAICTIVGARICKMLLPTLL